MKRITLEVKDDNYAFLMELLRNFNFVRVNVSDENAAGVLESTKRSLEQMQLMRTGKMEKPSVHELFED